MMPEITLRSSTLRAPPLFLGRSGSMTAHCSSDSQNRRTIQASKSLIWRLESDLLHQINAINGF
ncbi:MAG: hypothetical protein R3D70_18710 [Rhizobiaceae bacterium]